MKTLAALSLALASALVFGPAMAEPFNERGEDFIASVKISLHTKHRPVAVEFGNFNERGDDFKTTAPAGSYKRYAPVMAKSTGFNERGEDFIAEVRVGPETDLTSADMSLIGLDY